MHTGFRRYITLTGLALGALALTATSAAAQDKAQAGFLLGASFSTVTGADSGVAFRSSTGIAGGFFVNFAIARQVRLEPELLYVNKGAGLKGTGETINLNYLEIPVLLRYQFTANDGPFAFAGPYVGLNVQCNSKVDTVATACADQNVSARTTFGGTAGVGFHRDTWGFDVRYDYDFTDAIKASKGKNSALLVLLRLTIS